MLVLVWLIGAVSEMATIATVASVASIPTAVGVIAAIATTVTTVTTIALIVAIVLVGISLVLALVRVKACKRLVCLLNVCNKGRDCRGLNGSREGHQCERFHLQAIFSLKIGRSL